MLITYLPTILWVRNLGGSFSLSRLGLGGIGLYVMYVSWQTDWSGELNWNSLSPFHLVSHLSFMVLHTVVSGVQRVAREGKPQWTSTCQASACIMFANVSKANQCNSQGQNHINEVEGKFHSCCRVWNIVTPLVIYLRYFEWVEIKVSVEGKVFCYIR